MSDRMLCARSPRGFVGHPLLPGVDTAEIAARLAPFVDPDAVWTVEEAGAWNHDDDRPPGG